MEVRCLNSGVCAWTAKFLLINPSPELRHTFFRACAEVRTQTVRTRDTGAGSCLSHSGGNYIVPHPTEPFPVLAGLFRPLSSLSGILSCTDILRQIAQELEIRPRTEGLWKLRIGSCYVTQAGFELETFLI